MTIYVVEYERGNSNPSRHTEDHPTEAAAEARARDLVASGLSRVVVYAVEEEL